MHEFRSQIIKILNFRKYTNKKAVFVFYKERTKNVQRHRINSEKYMGRARYFKITTRF